MDMLENKKILNERLELLFWVAREIDTHRGTEDEVIRGLKRLIFDIENAYCDILEKAEG